MSGNIAEDFVARAAADGYTLLVAGFSMVTVPGIYGEKAVDPVQAFAPIAILATQPLALMVHASLGFHSPGDLVAEARRHPRKLTYSTTGAGSPASLVAQMLWQRAGVELLHIPYGTSGAFKDLLSGEVPITFDYLQGKETYLESGQLTALAVTGKARVATFPNIPTIAEQGYPGSEFNSWFGLLAPADARGGCPPAEPRVGAHSSVARDARTVRRLGHGGGGGHTRALCDADQGAVGALDADRQGGQHQGRLTRRSCCSNYAIVPSGTPTVARISRR